jgi:hypothetical protein
MESKTSIKKIALLMAFTSLISFACLGLFSDFEKGPLVDTDYFSFSEPRFKDDPRNYDVDKYDDYAAIYDEDNEMMINLYIGYGDSRDLERQMDDLVRDRDIRDHSDFKKLRVGGFPALSTNYTFVEKRLYSETGQIIVVDLQEEADDEVYLFIFAGVMLDDDELEEAQERYESEVDPMLEIILDTIEFYDLDDF